MSTISINVQAAHHGSITLDNVPASGSWEITVVPSAGAGADATALFKALKNKIRDTISPANSSGGFSTESKKLLILVGDGTEFPWQTIQLIDKSKDVVLPVFAAGTKGLKLIEPYAKYNALFWQLDISEVVISVIGIIGISDDELRVFISYRRTDTEKLAVQLFDRLSHEGFDVFLDRFSIEPTVDFQNRLYQDLADKAMVVVLESPDYLKSKWVQFELDFIRINRIGYLVLNLPTSEKAPSLDDAYRHSLTGTDFSSDGKLNDEKLQEMVLLIKQSHSQTLYLTKQYIQQSLLQSIPDSKMEDNGSISFTANADIHFVWATPRPPAVKDYYRIVRSGGQRNTMVGPSFMEEHRRSMNDWISSVSSIRFIEEGRMSEILSTSKP